MGLCDITTWTITENIQGMRNQCNGLANALGLDFHEKIITKRSWYAPYLSNVPDEFKYPQNFPDIIIACGRQSIRPSLYFKKHSKIIYIQDPKVFKNQFDIIIAPTHDQINGSNVINTLGTVHMVNEKLLNQKELIFETYKRPHHVILIGGPNKHYNFDYESILNQIKQINSGSILVSCSRRTPYEFLNLIKSKVDYLYDFNEQNTYFELLKTADTITVTLESVNMISEACATKAPVFLMPLIEKRKNKFNKFHQELLNINRVKFFDPSLEKFPVQKLNIVAETAKKVAKILNLTNLKYD